MLQLRTNHYALDGSLKIGQYKSIDCKVQLEILSLFEDDWAITPIQINQIEFIDGVKARGEFSFDTSPLDLVDDHPVRKKVVAELILTDDIATTKMNILIVENKAVVEILPKKIKRYFWEFYPIGKPIWDGCELFPTTYRGKTMNRVYTCTNFRGYWPVGVASIIIASNKQEAEELLLSQLSALSIKVEHDDFNITEIDIQSKGVFVLVDGK